MFPLSRNEVDEGRPDLAVRITVLIGCVAIAAVTALGLLDWL